MPARRIDVRYRLEMNRKIDPVTGCWLWTKSCGKRGYGQIWVVDRYIRVSRASYEIFIGPIPDGLQVLHECDNPPCFNPDHLWTGTHKDNMEDMSTKGRGVKPHKVCHRGHEKNYRGGCKQCAKEYHQKYYLNNRVEMISRATDNYWNNLEARRQKARDRWSKRKESVICKQEQ